MPESSPLVIDNFSRRILAWKVTPSFDAGATAEILLTAAKGVDHGTPTVLVDGGIENFNGTRRTTGNVDSMGQFTAPSKQQNHDSLPARVGHGLRHLA